MRRLCVAALALIWLLNAGLVRAEGEKLVFIYYYTWYGSQALDNHWMHWQENGHFPPGDISSSFYPKLGAYSSGDLNVIDQHMRWIAGANINALIYSWWGRDDFTDQVARRVLDAASDYNLKVSFLIEPYPGRTPRTICNDIDYLARKFGNHPAFLQLAHNTRYGQSPAKRPVFFIYDPEFVESEMKQVADEIHASDHNSILLLQSTNADFIDSMHPDGLFAYEAVQNVMHFYKGLLHAVDLKESIFIPCVAPGFNTNRTFGRSFALFRPRMGGATYDDWWRQTLSANPQFIAIISFNEWHEGTQIEPAVSMKSGSGYASYLNAYGKKEPDAEQSYLRRTASWIDVFLQLSP